VKRKFAIAIPLFLLVTLGVYVFAYTYVSRSDSYVAAVEFLSGLNDVHQSFGEKRSYKLAYTGWSLSFLGPRGEASLKIHIAGTKNSGTAFVHLISKAGLWKVQEANLFPKNGRPIPLSIGGP